jgi:hypothetical protein
MSSLLVVARLKPGALERARELLAEGPPFDLERSAFESHEVFLGESEVVFLFTGRKATGGTLALEAEDPELWRAAGQWAQILDGRPGIARSVFSWRRDR